RVFIRREAARRCGSAARGPSRARSPRRELQDTRRAGDTYLAAFVECGEIRLAALAFTHRFAAHPVASTDERQRPGRRGEDHELGRGRAFLDLAGTDQRFGVFLLVAPDSVLVDEWLELAVFPERLLLVRAHVEQDVLLEHLAVDDRFDQLARSEWPVV